MPLITGDICSSSTGHLIRSTYFDHGGETQRERERAQRTDGTGGKFRSHRSSDRSRPFVSAARHSSRARGTDGLDAAAFLFFETRCCFYCVLRCAPLHLHFYSGLPLPRAGRQAGRRAGRLSERNLEPVNHQSSDRAL